MKKGYEKWIILGIFIFALLIRLYFSFTSNYFNDDYSYFILRQVENIQENNVPIFNDELSFSGRIHVFSPIYHYFLSLFALISPIALKLIPNILASFEVDII